MQPRLIAAVILSLGLLFSQTSPTVYNHPAALSYHDQVKRQAMPTTMTPLISQDVYIEDLQFTIPSTCTGNPVITVQDNQSSPQPIFSFSTTPPAAGAQDINWPMKQVWAPGGVSWSSTNACVIGAIWWSR